MNSAIGIDLGSRTTKIVKLQNTDIVHISIIDTGPNPLPVVQQVLSEVTADCIVATGYGRNLLKQHLTDSVITEIKACARGAFFLNPDCRTIIDIGGQDTKVIKVEPGGLFSDFEMNDRCAAGTGRFLEVMARTLEYNIHDFGVDALQAKESVKINSICTVFAESEVVALMTSGEKRSRIGLGLHDSIVERVRSLFERVQPEPDIMLAGGVAQNPCIHHLLQKKTGFEIHIPQEPQIVVALGAALTGIENLS